VDVDARTGNIDTSRIEEAAKALVAGGKKGQKWLPRSHQNVRVRAEQVKAILPVAVFGQPADMDPISIAAKEYGLKVVEDSCEAIGSCYKGRKAGMLGDVGVFSFYPNKQITTAEGGMIVTDREDWALILRSLRNQGRDEFSAWLNHARLGFNYRLNEMSAALGLAQLRRLDELLTKRDKIAALYQERLLSEEQIEIPHVAQTTSRMSWFVYAVRIKPPLRRNILMSALAEQGIPTRPYFSPIHLQPFYAKTFGYRRGDYPAAEQLGETSLALPFSGVMKEEEVDRVCDCLKQTIKVLLGK
jgi:dTDP-4-amino-4,6-dideoxygalactose transaminase